MAHGDGQSAKFGMVALFYRSVEGIHVDVYDFPFFHEYAKIVVSC
jgi:hypothetical protein